MRFGQLDFAIENLPALMPVTNHALLFQDQFACMTRKRPAAGAAIVATIVPGVFACCRDGERQQPPGDRRCAASSRIASAIALRVLHYTVIPQILQRTDWMVTLHRGAAQFFNESGQFSIYPLPVEIPDIESAVHWHDTFDNDEGNRWFRELIIETLRPD